MPIVPYVMWAPGKIKQNIFWFLKFDCQLHQQFLCLNDLTRLQSLRPSAHNYMHPDYLGTWYFISWQQCLISLPICRFLLNVGYETSQNVQIAQEGKTYAFEKVIVPGEQTRNYAGRTCRILTNMIYMNMATGIWYLIDDSGCDTNVQEWRIGHLMFFYIWFKPWNIFVTIPSPCCIELCSEAQHENTTCFGFLMSVGNPDNSLMFVLQCNPA